MSEEELTIKISKELMKELDRVSGLLGWDIPTLARLTLEDYALGYEIFMDNITFAEYKEDKEKLEKIFAGNPEILGRLNDLHKRINSAIEIGDEDKETEILATEYEQFFAELYDNYQEVRKLHKNYHVCICGNTIKEEDLLCQECREKK